MVFESFYWKKSQPLAESYIQLDIQARTFFENHYQDELAWQERALWLNRQSAQRVDPAALAKVLSAYNQRIGNSLHAQKAIDGLVEHQAYVVIGGQQAGLFGGPLLTIYKAISLLQLAEQARQKLQHEVIPIFWIAGEDHDFEEVNHLYYTTPGYRIDKLKVERPRPDRTSVSQLPLSNEQWVKLIHQLEHTLADSTYKRLLIEKLYMLMNQTEMSLTESFAKIMVMLFGEYGLVMVDADDPQLRALEAPFFTSLITHNQQLSEMLMTRKQQIEDLGYEPQTEFEQQHAHLFVYEQQQRTLLIRDGQAFVDKKRTLHYTQQQLLDIARERPQLLSNSVMTRPLMQEYVFPVVATVLGSAEIAYWGLVKPAFHMFDMKMPIIVPRLEFTLIEPKIKQLLRTYEFSVEDVLFHYADQSQAWRDQEDHLGIAQRFEDFEKSFIQSYQPLIQWVSQIHPNLQELGQTHINKIIEQFNYIKTKALWEMQSKEDSISQHLTFIQNALHPFAKPQERVYNVMSYINTYGHTWIHHMIHTRIPLDGKHRIYYL